MTEANFFFNAVWEFDTRSALVAPTLAALFAGILILVSPLLVANGYFTLGEVLAALQAVTSMGDECELFFQSLVQARATLSRARSSHHSDRASRPSPLRPPSPTLLFGLAQSPGRPHPQPRPTLPNASADLAQSLAQSLALALAQSLALALAQSLALALAQSLAQSPKPRPRPRQIQHAVSALLKLTHLLNLPTDVGDRMRANRWRRQRGKAKRLQAREALDERRSSCGARNSLRVGAYAVAAFQPGGRSGGARGGAAPSSTPAGAAATSSPTTPSLIRALTIRRGSAASTIAGTPPKSAPWGLSRLAAPRRTASAYAALEDEEEGGGADHFDAWETPRFAADIVDIELRNVSLSHSPLGALPSSAEDPPHAAARASPSSAADSPSSTPPEPAPPVVALRSIDLRIEQGRIVAVVGAPSSGKATLLRLIAGVLLPSSGEVFSPPHLTIVHVEQQPQLMAMSLAENLWLGRRQAFDREALERVCAVCETIGLPERLLKSIRRDFHIAGGGKDGEGGGKGGEGGGGGKGGGGGWRSGDEGSWHTALDLAMEKAVDSIALEEVGHLPQTHAALVHLARSFIASPEVLVLQRPLALLDEAIARRVLSVLRAFVSERGLRLDPATRSSRRLRTVVFSCRSLEQALEIADDVIVVGMPVAGGASLFTAEQLGADATLRTSVVAAISTSKTEAGPAEGEAPTAEVSPISTATDDGSTGSASADAGAQAGAEPRALAC